MSDHIATELGRLYRDYFAGRLQFDDYRHRRGLLLDSLSTTQEDVLEDLVTQPNTVKSADILAQIDQSSQQASQPPARQAPAKADKSAFSGRLLGLAAAVVVFAVVVFVSLRLIQPADESQVQVNPAVRGVITTVPPQAAAQEALVHSPGAEQLLVEEFLNNDDWSDGSISAFQNSWTGFPVSDRNAAKGSTWFQPLVAGFQEKIAEARALAIDPDNDEQLGRLYLFALGVGLVELVPAGWTPALEAAPRLAAEKAPVEKTPVEKTPTKDSKTGGAVAAGPPTVVAAAVPPAAVVKPDVTAPAEATQGNKEPAAGESAGSMARPVSDFPCTADLLKTRKRGCFDMLADGTRGPLLRVLPAGEFRMGNDDYPDEGPAHLENIASPYAISMFETTHSEYAEYCKATAGTCPGSPWPGEDMPVVNVSWQDANKYAEWLSRATGQKYRLPTEAEWEYAARGGTTTLYPFGDEVSPTQARYSFAEPLDRPLPMADKTTQRNTFELWHVVGNVREWVAGDSSANSLKVARGGSYASPAAALRSSARQRLPAQTKDKMTGFRLVREL